MMANVIVILIVALCVMAAVLYIRKEKKRGVTCIGCPNASMCAKKAQGGCGTESK